MLRVRSIRTLLIAAVLSTLPGCVVLKGQRITLHYDEAADCLTLLVAYDGVHDSRGEKFESESPEKLAKFVREGEILVFDWWCHLKPAQINPAEIPAPTPDSAVTFAETLLDSMHVDVLGHYRSPSGALGALQRIRIDRAGQLVARLNAALSDALPLAALMEIRGPWGKTLQRAAKRAKQRPEWIRIEGHSLVLDAPVHPGEWARGRAALTANLAGVIKAPPQDPGGMHPDWIARALAAGPFSLAQRQEGVTLRLGHAEAPATFRFPLRSTYHPSLEAKVLELAPTNLDAALAASLLAPEQESKVDGTTELIALLPPEARVGAVIAALKADPEKLPLVRSWLETFAKEWKRDLGWPAVPAPVAEPAELSESWSAWYDALTSFGSN